MIIAEEGSWNISARGLCSTFLRYKVAFCLEAPASWSEERGEEGGRKLQHRLLISSYHVLFASSIAITISK